MKKVYILVSLFLICCLLGCSNVTTSLSANEHTTRVYENCEVLGEGKNPVRLKEPNERDYVSYKDYLDAIDKYNKERNSMYLDSVYKESFYTFLSNVNKEFLLSGSNTNTIYSPINIYLALSSLAEITAGTSRSELLNLLGVNDIETLRDINKRMYYSLYEDDEYIKVILANSLWLNNYVTYKEECIDILESYYSTDTFRGLMGSSEYDNLLRDWTNNKTNNLLVDSVKDLEFDINTIFAICSTIYFKGSYRNPFNESLNIDDIFHSDSDINTTYMRKSSDSYVYETDDFISTSISLSQSGYYIDYILPLENKSVSSLLNNSEFTKFLYDKSDIEGFSCTVNYKIPKYDVSAKLDLIPSLKNLGIEKIFDPNQGNFSNLTDLNNLYIDKIEHAARVKVDEEGVEAAAYTFISNKVTSVGPREILDFILDRSFIFVVRNFNNIPLFIGVVNNPNITK